MKLTLYKYNLGSYLYLRTNHIRSCPKQILICYNTLYLKNHDIGNIQIHEH